MSITMREVGPLRRRHVDALLTINRDDDLVAITVWRRESMSRFISLSSTSKILSIVSL
jgi:hypothetical protein